MITQRLIRAYAWFSCDNVWVYRAPAAVKNTCSCAHFASGSLFESAHQSDSLRTGQKKQDKCIKLRIAPFLKQMFHYREGTGPIPAVSIGLISARNCGQKIGRKYNVQIHSFFYNKWSLKKHTLTFSKVMLLAACFLLWGSRVYE